MIIFKSINKLREKVNFKANIGFVPTMGSLHKGHESLIKKSKKKCKKTLVSIFINPTQFNVKNDFSNYPRNITKDIKILKKLNVDYLLIPKESEIYKHKKYKKIAIPKKDKILCAKYRPGHFEGVLAVINQFLRNIRPKFIFLGEKDFQQAILINKFIQNKFKTKVVLCKTIRMKNLVPYSSRNFLLSKNDFKKAVFVSKLIKKFFILIKNDFNKKNNLNKIKKKINENGIRLEYLEIRNKKNLSNKIGRKNYKIFISYYIKNVRMIDNL